MPKLMKKAIRYEGEWTFKSNSSKAMLLVQAQISERLGASC